MTTLEWARYYKLKGFSVIPLKPKSKVPAIDSWKEYQSRHATDEEITEWFGNGSNNNIAIVTGKISGLAVIDLDSRKAVQFAKENQFPKTPLVRTGKDNAYHAYCKHKNGVTNFQKRDDLPDIDLRAEGGYVVAPPSIHPSGKLYQSVAGKGLDDLPLADLPEMILTQRPEHKKPLKELYNGVYKGNRNHTLARLTGSWVNDGLSIHECRDMALSWNQKNSPPLPDNEIQRTVKSIFEKHHKERPTDTVQRINMSLTRLGDLLKEPDVSVTWLVDGILPTGGFSVIASKPKVGKSTLARNLALCTARGDIFLDRSVNKGAVIYYALEEKKSEVKRHFKDMGADGTEDIYIYAGGTPVDAILQIREVAQSIEPELIIIDPLFRLARVRDGNDYVQVTNALEPLLRLARDTESHVLCVHHTNKGAGQDGDSVLGSTAIFSSVDTLMIMKRLEKYRTIKTIQRYGDDLEETTLNFNKDARIIDIGKSKQEEDICIFGDAIIDFLTSQNEPTLEEVIMGEVEGKTGIKRKALRELVKDEKVTREGKGAKGDPYKYSCSLVPTYSTEQENENLEKPLTHDNDDVNACSHSSIQNLAKSESREQESDALITDNVCVGIGQCDTNFHDIKFNPETRSLKQWCKRTENFCKDISVNN